VGAKGVDLIGVLRKLARHRWPEKTDEMLLGMLIAAADKAATELEKDAAELATLREDNARLTREIDEARAEREELREQAETLPADFDSDCWRALRSLLAECNFDWRDTDPEGITADQAEEHISTTLDELEKGEAHWKARAENAERETARKCAEIERLRAALALYGDRIRMSFAPPELQPVIDDALVDAAAIRAAYGIEEQKG
jgi:FtsZ-binding cell division protein ZapB